ncbi:MAG: hypothetical protein J7M25_00220 [Deltaproteobacteria bacterium]|nr:hypothetical protein [Deltaproteobacteria bacterium]
MQNDRRTARNEHATPSDAAAPAVVSKRWKVSTQRRIVMRHPVVTRHRLAMPRRLVLVGGLVGVLATLLTIWACKAPSFPLPPPDPNQLQVQPYSSDGFMVITGSPAVVEPNSEVHMFNESKGFGYYFYAGADGAFTSPPMSADEGDRIQFFYLSNGDSSRPLCFLVDYSQNPPPECQ